MIAREQSAVRNAGVLLALRGIQIAGGLVFAALVPRLMGPQGYGQVSLLVALSMWFTIVAGLGFTEVMGREVPRYTQTGDRDGLRKLIGRLLAIRVSVGFLSAGAYVLVTTIWLRDLDKMAMVLLSLAVCIRAPAGFFFSLHLGLNRADRWGLAEIVRQWGYMAFMLPGYLVGGLRGAALGVLLAELVVFSVGFVGTRSHLAGIAFRLDLKGMAPALRFGLVFYASDLLVAAFERSGDILLRSLGGDYAQIGYLRVAYSAYATIAIAVPRIAIAFMPLLTMLCLEGDRRAMREWLERLLKWLGVGSMLVVLGAVLVGNDLVPLVLGREYRPVGPNLMALAFALLGLSLTSVANLAALTFDRPAMALVSAGVRLLAFWVLGIFLVARFGSLGACLSVLGAMLAQAGFFTVAMRRVAGYSLRRWFLVVTLGGLFLPLCLLRASPFLHAAMFGGAVLGYGGLLLLFRLVTVEELRAMQRVLRRRDPVGSMDNPNDSKHQACVSP
jgi:O-antigen/teichoic acid export membrane protein